MKLAWFAAALLATLGCEQAPSKLDRVAKSAEADGGGGGGGASGDVEARLARLEKKLSKVDKEALDFLQFAYERQAEAEAQPKPGQIYAPDIQPNISLGTVEGSPEALVTIVEAWDFA